MKTTEGVYDMIDTAKCKMLICMLFATVGMCPNYTARTRVGSWSRESKEGSKSGIVKRVFINKHDPTVKVSIKSKQDSIVAIKIDEDSTTIPVTAENGSEHSVSPNARFIFHVEKRSVWNTLNYSVVVYIVPADYWNRVGCLCDHYSKRDEDAIGLIIRAANLSEIAEATFEAVDPKATVADVRKSLLALGLREDKDFSAFMEE